MSDELARVGALNLEDALAEGKSLADFLSLCEFRNANDWRWSLGPEGAEHIAAAVRAHLESDAVKAALQRRNRPAPLCALRAVSEGEMAEVVGENPAFVKTATCRSCAAIVRYTESELRERVKRDYLGDATIYHELTCPRCKADIVVRAT